MHLNLKGEWTLITGATCGVGYEMAKVLASKGENMVLVGAEEEGLCHMARELSEVSDIIVMPVDLCASGSARMLFDECERLGLNISVFINNACYVKLGESSQISTEEMEAMLTLNLTSLTTLSKLFGGKMKARGRGYILHVSSTGLYPSITCLAANAASRNYVESFTIALHKELIHHGVEVSCLFPGSSDVHFVHQTIKSHLNRLVRKRPGVLSNQGPNIIREKIFGKNHSMVSGAFNSKLSGQHANIPPSVMEQITRKYSRN